jgi:hypothetical protein
MGFLGVTSAQAKDVTIGWTSSTLVYTDDVSQFCCTLGTSRSAEEEKEDRNAVPQQT